MTPGPSARQRGVALLIVLLLLATMSLVAITMTQALRGATGRALSAESLDQSRWYALGAEALAAGIVQQQWLVRPAHDSRMEDWLTQPVFVPFDGGQIEARIADDTGCFNLNSLVLRDDQALEENPEARERFEYLLEALGLDAVARESIAEAIVDWLDTDFAAGTDGAEDGDYARLSTPYRAGNTLMADITELRAVMWISPELYALLRPYVCVHPEIAATKININLVTQAEAPVLYAAFAGLLEPAEIESLIDAIPDQGFIIIDQFWALPVFSGRDLPAGIKDRFVLYSGWLRMDAKVNFNQAFILQRSLLEVDDKGAVRVAARTTGPDS